MRWIVRVFVGLVVLVLVAVVTLLLLPSERIAAVVTDRFEKATGRQMTIAGDITPSFWPALGVKIGQVSIANADWTDGQPMVSAEDISVGVDMAALMGGEIKVTEVVIQSPRIRLEKARNGQVNWDLSNGGAGGSDGQSSGGIPAFSLDQGTIRDAQISYFDRAAGTAMVLTKTDVDMSLPSFTGPMDVSVKGFLNGEPLDTTLKIESFADLLAGKGKTVGGDVTIGNSSATFGGILALAPVGADMEIDATLKDLAQVFRAIGQAPPKLPKGMGERISVKGKVTFSDGDKIFLRNGILNLDGNALSGEADVVIGAKPRVTGRFAGGQLDFSRLMSSGGSDSGGGISGWSKDRIDVSGLGAIDADISLSAKGIDLGALRFGSTNVRMTLTDRRVVFALNDVRAYDGSAKGQFVLNGRGGLSVGGDLNLASVQIQPLLKDLTGYERLIGQSDVNVKFLSSGNSVDSIMKSLSGSGAFNVGKGELLGLDIVGMIRNLDPSFVGPGQKTIFDRIDTTFTIDQGVLSNNDLNFRAPLMTATGRGTVGIGNQTLNYTVTPAALQGADGTGGIKVPLQISGTWANPKYGLDVKALADQNFAKERDNLKARLQAEAEKALGLSLGGPAPAPAPDPALTEQPAPAPEPTPAPTTAEPTPTPAPAPAPAPETTAPVTSPPPEPKPALTLEQQLEQKLREEAKKGLLNLLGGN